MADRREKEKCGDHEAQHKSIALIARSVKDQEKLAARQEAATARQDGQWKILMWGITLLFGAVLLFGLSVHNSTKTTHKLVESMDKTYTVYMMTHKQESARGFELIAENDLNIIRNRQFIHEHEDRLNVLEKHVH